MPTGLVQQVRSAEIPRIGRYADGVNNMLVSRGADSLLATLAGLVDNYSEVLCGGFVQEHEGADTVVYFSALVGSIGFVAGVGTRLEDVAAHYQPHGGVVSVHVLPDGRIAVR